MLVFSYYQSRSYYITVLYKDVGLAVLGTLIEPLSKTKKSVRVNYSLLETNRKGEICAVPLSREVSTLEAIVHANDMVGY